MSKELKVLIRNYGQPLRGLVLTELDRIKELEAERDTAWAQAHRLALELECLILDTKDNAVVSKWWDSAMSALEEFRRIQDAAIRAMKEPEQ